MSASPLPLQNLPSHQISTNGSILTQQSNVNGTSTSTANQSSTFGKSSISQVTANVTRTVRSLRKNCFRFFKYWFRPLICVALYILTVHTAWTAPNQNALLGRVRASFGTWLLAIFAKAGDICFAFAVEDTFDVIAWRKLKARKRNDDVVRLEWFLSVISNTGIEGLVRLLWRRFHIWFVKLIRSNHTTRLSATGAQESREQRWRRWLRNGRGARWTFARLFFLIILIPGPGIILMADTNQTTLFFDMKSMNVSAGLGIFDPSIANATRPVIAPIVSRFIQVMLQDRSLSWPVDPVDDTCKATKNCTSYLIAGPYSIVSPWPFPKANESLDTAGFRVKNAPYYQVDMWDASPETLAISQSKNCVIYGGLDAIKEYSTMMCIADQDTKGVLGAAWVSCQLGYSSTNGTCLAPGSRDDWATFFRFYRRNATLVFSRSGLQILEVTDLSEPQPQDVPSSTLFTALDAVLYQPNRSSAQQQFYDVRSAEYLLTQTIGVQLWQSLYPNARGLNIGRDWLRNLVTFPVYLFQPTRLELLPYLLPISEDNGTVPQPNLPSENYVQGSFCKESKRTIPGRETVYAYTAVAGLLVAFVIIAKARAFLWRDVDTSDFSILDYHALTYLTDNKPGRVEVSLQERLAASGREYGTSAMLDVISDLRIGLR